MKPVPAHEQPAKAEVSRIGWKGVPIALWYVLACPVTVSVTVTSTPTLVSPETKNQNFWSRPQASTTLATSSRLLPLKKEKYPESSVVWKAVPAPLVPCGACQAACTWNRLWCRHSWVEVEEQLGSRVGG